MNFASTKTSAPRLGSPSSRASAINAATRRRSTIDVPCDGTLDAAPPAGPLRDERTTSPVRDGGAGQGSWRAGAGRGDGGRESASTVRPGRQAPKLYQGELPVNTLIAPARPGAVLPGGQFGWRIAPDRGGREFHNGTDVSAAAGLPVVAALDGVVTAVFWDVWGGNRVEVANAGARLVLARELQLAAAEVRRTGAGRMTTLTHVVASSCQVCASDPTPLWEIRARSVTHDAQTHRIHFDRPQFRAFGLPLAVLPALSAPDPGVDRMSGFLAPRFRTTSGLGFGVMLPYFVTLGDSADVTLTPYVSSSRTATLGLRYRQAFVNGATEWNGAISRDDIRTGTRGYLFGAAAFRLPRDYRLGVQVQTASDRAYLLDYDITDADRLWSGMTLERIKRDRLLTARIGRYETLREDEDEATSPGLVGDALWERRFSPAGFGGEAGLQFSAHTHRRSSGRDIEGRDMARASARADWNRNWIMPGGVVAAAKAQLDADLYRIRDDSRFDTSQARAYPTAGVEFRWPLISHAGAAMSLLEPVAQIAWSPTLDDDDAVPNEDSRLVEFDEGNLFALDRMPGHDAIEEGLRANLGLTWTRIDPTGWSLGLTAGRVLREHPAQVRSAGGEILWGKRSDWLLAATYSGNQGLAFASRALFDDDLDMHRSESRLGWLAPGFQLSAGYLWIDAETEQGRPSDVSELTATTGWQLAQGWWADAETRYDFIADRARKAELGVTYRNECVSVDLSVSRRFTASDNLRPDTDVGLSVRLGGFGRQNGEAAPGTVARRSCLR